MERWPWATLSTTKGEYPKRNPPTQHAGRQSTKRRHATQQPQALRAGAKVSAAVVEATGPTSHVSGANTMPASGALALSRRLTPCGGQSHVVEKGSSPWLRAYAGQAMNQTCWPGSRQPHRTVDAAPALQAFHQRKSAGRV